MVPLFLPFTMLRAHGADQDDAHDGKDHQRTYTHYKDRHVAPPIAYRVGSPALPCSDQGHHSLPAYATCPDGRQDRANVVNFRLHLVP
jgi:hypothetical protein